MGKEVFRDFAAIKCCRLQSWGSVSIVAGIDFRAILYQALNDIQMPAARRKMKGPSPVWVSQFHVGAGTQQAPGDLFETLLSGKMKGRKVVGGPFIKVRTLDDRLLDFCEKSPPGCPMQTAHSKEGFTATYLVL